MGYTTSCFKYGRLAQLVELPLDVRKVRDSSSLPSTRKKPIAFAIGFFFCKFIINYSKNYKKRIATARKS